MESKNAVIVIQAYNKTEPIYKIIIDLFDNIFRDVINWKIKILIIDANLADDTANIVRALMKKYDNLDIFIDDKKEDKVSVYIKGFKYAVKKYDADVLIKFDEDFQHSPEVIPMMLDEIDKGNNYVIVSRNEKDNNDLYYKKYKNSILNRINIFLLRFLLFFPFKHFFSLTNPLNSVKAIKINDNLKNIKFNRLANNDFGFNIFLLCYMVRSEEKIKEILFKTDKLNDSTKKSVSFFEILKLIIYFRFNDGISLKFVKFCFIGLFGLFINSFFLEVFARSALLDKLVLIFLNFNDMPVLNILSTKSSWAAGISAELAIISNFIFNNFLTFYKTKIKGFLRIILKFLLFNLTSIGGVVIQFILIGLSVLLFGDFIYVRQVTLLLVVFFVIVPYNWLMYNKVIWSKKGL